MAAELERAARAVGRAGHIVVLTGAGISKDSGLPTFREAQTGLWAQYRPEDLATPEAFDRRPDLVWRWYAWRRELVARAAPNGGHFAIAEMERLAPRLTLVTQNVDGLHRRAGSRDVIELHGDITRIRCSACGRVDPEPGSGEPPACLHCGAGLRPDVVWFGEMLPEKALRRATAAAAACDVLLSVGTSGMVYPAAGLVDVAARAGATVVVVNPDTAVGRGAVNVICLGGGASDVLPALVAAAWPEACSAGRRQDLGEGGTMVSDDGAVQTATLGGGCFWCLEAVFAELDGVLGVVSGYAGGHVEQPAYQQVCSGTTGHAEVVQVRFDPAKITYRDLLEVFFTIHDPTTRDRQGADVGSQYRSIILYDSPEQKVIAEEVVAAFEAEGVWKGIVTELVPLDRFWPAEAYHRDYYRRNPDQAYCRVVIAPKLAKLRKHHMEKLRSG